MSSFLTVVLMLATAVILQRNILSANGQPVTFPFAFKFLPFKFPKRADGQLDWSSWTMLKAGPYAYRPQISHNNIRENGQEEFYGPESGLDITKSSVSPRNLGLCHFKICPVGKRNSASPSLDQLDHEIESNIKQLNDSPADYGFSVQK